MRNILLIGDDAVVPFGRALEADGFVVQHQLPGDQSASRADPDVIVIDLSSTGEDPAARRALDAAAGGDAAPVMVIVQPDQLATLDPARELDDFVLATTVPEELSARVRQVLWRRHQVDTGNTLRCGDLLMDLNNYTVHIAGRPVELTFKEYELLRFLATNRDRVFSRETLLNKVWGYDFYGGARTVDVHIRRLRAKIEDRHHAFVETVRNVGYRFRVGP